MQLRTIVIGMDLSAMAVALSQWVAKALAPQAEIVFAHAVDSPLPPPYLDVGDPDTVALRGSARQEAEQRLRELAASIRADARCITRIGAPHQVIIDIARELDADLIAVGAHGNRAHESRILGTTADRLVRAAHVPVLVGPREMPSPPRWVLAAVADDATSDRVLAWANLFARQLDARIAAVHVISNATYSFIASLAAAHAHGDPRKEEAELRDELHAEARRWLAHSVAAGADPKRVDCEVLHGAASEQILEVARRQDATLAVLGRHRAAGGWRGLLGGTVMKVLHAAPCAVVVVPPVEPEA
jgi:nucleotide-binding universal stress UspA family protein